MSAAAKRLFARLSILFGASLLAACSVWSPAQTDAGLVDSMAAADIVLIGEVHDNVAQHRLRLQWLRALADRGPIAIVSEHFDSDAQSRLDDARRTLDAGLSLPERARRVAEAAGFRFDGWDWSLIGPVVELALERNLPLRAANLSSREAYSIARGQAHPLAESVPDGWTVEIERAMSVSIRTGHCDLLPESMIPAMVRAQRARDAQMAAVVLAARAEGLKPVLLAGNGHVRRDLGVPVHLKGRPGLGSVLAVGLLEQTAIREEGVFDRLLVTEAQSRPDPCEGLRKHFGSRPAQR